MSKASLRSGWSWIKARFSFQGRASRKEYWLTLPLVLLCFGLGILLTAVMSVVISLCCAHFHLAPVMYILVICLPLILSVFVLYAWVLLAVSARRTHDLDQPLGFNVFSPGALRAYWSRGTIGPNQYGPDPLQTATPPA